MNNYDETFIQDLLSDYRWEQYLDAMDEEYDRYKELCAINGWDEDDYSFEEHLEEIKN